MRKTILNSLLIGAFASVLMACGADTKPDPAVQPAPVQPAPISPAPVKPEILPPTTGASFQCKEPRAEICTQQYDPVCGTSFEPMRCAKGMMCAAMVVPKRNTYSNSCSACSNESVQSYTKGACEANS
ncbi:hypothetical protein EOL70_15845 [Leucothrix sargassi]|nr:hypothetical protein EOL70_15845 [Leucothrix sargassi]